MATQAATVCLDRKSMTGPALRTFFNIAQAWGLREADQIQILGLDSRSTLQSWKRGAVSSISRDALERISYILGIYKALHILFPASADGWIHRPNTAPIFGGKPALVRLTSGNMIDLYLVRKYLDAQRG